MLPADVGALRERFLKRFLDAWPERDVPEEDVRSELQLAVSSDDDGQLLTVRLLGSTVSVGFDGSQQQATEVVDELADHIAYNAEGDRWIAGEGWREYKP